MHTPAEAAGQREHPSGITAAHATIQKLGAGPGIMATSLGLAVLVRLGPAR